MAVTQHGFSIIMPVWIVVKTAPVRVSTTVMVPYGGWPRMKARCWMGSTAMLHGVGPAGTVPVSGVAVAVGGMGVLVAVGGTGVLVGVAVGVTVAVLVGVADGVTVAVLVGVGEAVGRGVRRRGSGGGVHL